MGKGGALSYATLPKRPQKLKRKPGDYPTHEGYARILSIAEKEPLHNPQYLYLCKLQALAGLRESEALSLSKASLDVVDIPKAQHTITFRRKFGEIDTLPIQGELYDILKSWQGFTISRLVYDWFWRAKVDVQTRAGKPMHSHALRKYWGHCLIEKVGVAAAIVIAQAVYNHKSPTMTMHYLDVHKLDALSRYAEMIA